MKIPYRTQQALKRAGVVLLFLILTASLVFLCWFLWLERFVVYTRDQGAKLDMTLSEEFPQGQLAQAPTTGETVDIYYNEGENAINTSKELTQLTGYYATADDLAGGAAGVLEQIKALDPETPVMVDVKSSKGAFFYSSGIATHRASNINIEEMDALIAYLKSSNHYAIARLPAFRDYHYGLKHVSDGLPTSGGYLWADADYCYWLNPSSQGTLTYLAQIVSELKDLGFDEVVFEEFRFPDTEKIVFKADKKEALVKAAQTLVTACATDSFAVSFVQERDFALPAGRSRLYLPGVTAAEVSAVAQQAQVTDPALNLVFLTEVHDTRFEISSVLRPLDAAH